MLIEYGEYPIFLIVNLSQAMNPVEAHLWKERVLIVTASSPTSADHKKQELLFTKEKEEMKERELVVYRLYKDHWHDTNGASLNAHQADAIYHAYNINPDTFSVILIGKDGGVKMRKNDIVSTGELFRLIDSMPMRRQEMKRSKEPD